MSQKIAVYGSLKKGFYNHRTSMGEIVGRAVISGAMYLNSSYPHLYRPEDSEAELVRDYPVEIYNLEDNDYLGIRAMELGAGYQEVHVALNDEEGNIHNAIVFYSKDRENKGNWVEAYNEETAPFALANR